jgi:hypothetical protein
VKTSSTVKHIVSEEEKFELRMRLTHEQRFHAFMKALKLQSKLKRAKIIHAS